MKLDEAEADEVSPEAPPVEKEAKPDLCGFCRTGAHMHCPRAIRNGANAKYKLITCDCEFDPDVCGSGKLRCTYCKSEAQEDIDPGDWRCFDRNGCEARIQARLDSNPLYQQIIETRSRAMAKVANEKAEKAATAKKTATPKVGSCLHCGEATKGGKFLPGHDAAYVSTLVKASIDNPKSADANRKKANDASESLGKKFARSYELAQEKVAAKDKAASDREAAKTAKKATAATPA